MRLNLGSFTHTLDGWKNVDVAEKAEERVDLSVFPWKWKNNSITEILASHIIEHFTKDVGIEFMKECYRILKPGGLLHIAVPDYDIFAQCLNDRQWGRIGNYTWMDANWFFGGDDIRERDPAQRHKYAYNFETLAYILNEIGFSKVERVNFSKIHNPQYFLFSLYVDAMK